ncbi:MAG: UDP-glucose/GDP-mannose dehydrogenase family protein [Pseudomonadota bacterium]
MNLGFIGAGYVGLVSGAMLASLGHEVTCLDKDHKKISDLKRGIIPIFEPGLGGYIVDAMHNGHLKFMQDDDLGEVEYDAIFIAVGTPSLASGAVDLSFVYDAVLNVAKHTNPKTLIIIKSTVPPGTCEDLTQKLRGIGYMQEIASNPEFLREGNAIYDFLNPDRIVIGVSSEAAESILRNIYAPLKNQNIISTDSTTSELIKYASNAFLATKIAFINEMANLCEKVGADVETLSLGIGSDHRIGKAFLKAGPGFGGSCFPKDILGLSHIAKEHEQPCHVIDAVIFSNQNRRQYMVSKISDILGPLDEKAICVLGITFKAGTDDVRSSPAADIINIMLSQGARVRVYDPEGMQNGVALVPSAIFSESAYVAAKDADAVVVLTEWSEFADLDFERLGSVMKKKIMFDFRNILPVDTLRNLEFDYYSVGRRS